jgi:branched-chain amino acid aminotransferase
LAIPGIRDGFLFYFQAMNHLNFNGRIFRSDEPVLLATNRGYRYGDGLFETMVVQHDRIRLAGFHLERLFTGLQLLQFVIPRRFTPEKIRLEILELCKKNQCERLARVRLSVSRGNGGLYDEDKTLQYLVECWPLTETVNQLNENGLVIGIFPGARKSCDAFSNLKSANFLPYSMAAIYAKDNRLNDCLVLNSQERICDSTIANVFITRGNKLITPPLSEGCVQGVMRRMIMECGAQFAKLGFLLEEKPLNAPHLLEADEVFLTNAVNRIRWVRQFREKIYTNINTQKIYGVLEEAMRDRG